MSECEIIAAVERLNQILPLTAYHLALDAPLRKLHRAILQSYVQLGRSLNRSEMARYVDDVDGAVEILQRADLVLFHDNAEPKGAYPFTNEEREHIVQVNGHTVHCMCALDALAISPMFDFTTTVTSRCQVTNELISIQQDGLRVLNQQEAGGIYFGIDWSAAVSNGCCADSLCTEMIFLKTKTVAENWLTEVPSAAKGQRQIFALADAMDFAARFFVPLTKNLAG